MEAEFLTSSLLSNAGFTHAFFTRNGGVSPPPYASLSFSVSAGDSPDNVRENLVRAARILSVEPEKLFYLSQVHGRVLREVDGHSDCRRMLDTEGDALGSSDPSVACGVRSADCVPVLMADRRSGRVAAVHAGWRGVVAGAVESGVDWLKAGASGQADLVAAIGPHISVASFEVSVEVAAELAGVSPDPGVVHAEFGAKPHVDLRALVRAKLLSAGVSPGSVDDVAGCTVLDAARFFSFRRDGARSGRHLSAIVARRLLG